MHKRASRLAVATILVAAAIVGGFFVFGATRRADSVLASSGDVSARIERMIATIGDVASAQQAYVAPGQPDQPWLERSASLLQQFAGDLAAVRPRLRSAAAGPVAGEVANGLNTLIRLDGTVRLDLQQGQNLLAADLIFSEGRDGIAALIMSLRNLSAVEQSAAAALRASLARQQWAAIAIVGLVWLAGLLVLVPLPSAEQPPATTTATTTDRGVVTVDLRHDAPGPTSTIDLDAAAQVCTSFAQVASAASLPAVLARAAEVLDASGIIVWMGAGEELFPAMAQGYDDAIIRRLGPIPRQAANATAEAWRTGQMRTVASDVTSNGALAAPLAGVSGCVGVFAAEVRNGREADPSTRAVAAMFAAQLAGIVPAWPAGSVPAADVPAAGPVAAAGGA